MNEKCSAAVKRAKRAQQVYTGLCHINHKGTQSV